MVEIGLQIEPQFGFSYQDISDLARLCESVGFNSLWCSDHLFNNAQSVDQDCLDAWTVLGGLAVETSTLRLGTLVSCVSFRHPPILAKIAASVDTMSAGRVDFGIGAGWKQLEYEAYGIPFPSAGERVTRLEEALNIVTQMWSQPTANYQGRYYSVVDAFCAPKPVQKPHLPIWIGGSQPRMFGIAARFADAINISGFPTLEVYKERLEGLRAACERNDRDFDLMRKSHFTGVAIARDTDALNILLVQIASETSRTVDEVRSNFRGFMGTPDEVTAFLRRFVDLGVDQFMLVFPYGHEAESVNLMAEEVLPRLQE